MKEKLLKTHVMFPISAKLVILISFLLLASLGAVILMVSVLGTQEVKKTAEDNNFTVNHRAASQAEAAFNAVQTAVFFYLEMTDWVNPALDSGSERNRFERDPAIVRYFYSRNRNIAAIGVTRSGDDSERPMDFIPNTDFLESNGIGAADAQAYLAAEFRAVEGEMRLYNASPVFQLPLSTLVFVHQGWTGNETVKVLFTPDDLSESFGTGTNTSFLINGSADLLLHSEYDLVLGGANFSSLPIVAVMQQQGDSNRQVSYNDGGVEYFGAYYRLAGTDAVVITTIPYELVFEAVQGITRQNVFLALGVLFIAIIFIWIFSKTITNPVRILVSAAQRIEGGDFDIELERETNDEVGLLTDSFDHMAKALSIFGRFTNKDIATRAMRGEIKPGGLPKHATVFFSDIRGFTKQSEDFVRAFGDDAPNRIVLWLNDYFTHMIRCMEKTGGVVDKFIGDALMAHWGTAITTGNPADDAYNCVKAALLMRETLIALNAERDMNDPGNPAIHIGCSINTGMVIAGQIGSEERMEYTIIGSPVNLANRVEALNKAFGTDILITEDTWRLTGDRFITEEMLPVTIKGVEMPVRLFAVVNLINSSGPQTLAEVRALLGIEAPDLGKLDIEAEEKKYAIHGSVEAGDDETGEKKIVDEIPDDSKFDDNRMDDTKPESVVTDKRKTDRRKAGRRKTDKVKVIVKKDPEIAMTSFGPTAWVLGSPEEAIPVFFSWTVSGFSPDTHVIVEVALDQYYKNIVEERDVSEGISVSIPLKLGLYWWRAYPVNGESRTPLIQNFPFGTLMVSSNEKEKKN